jgi:hypothetical protein
MTFFVTVFCFQQCYPLNSTGSKCMEIQGVEMVTIIGGLYCIGFIYSINVVARVRRQRLALSIWPN